MVDTYAGPFAGVVTPAGVAIQTTQDNINAEVDKIIALFPTQTGLKDSGGGPSAPSPDFDHIHPETRDKIRAELEAFKTAIDAMAIA